MFSCATVKDYLSRYYDRECSNNLHSQIEKHLNTSEKCMECQQCIKELDDYRYVRLALSHLPTYDASQQYHRSFAEKLATCKKEPNNIEYPAFKKKKTFVYGAITAAAMIVLFMGASLFTTSTTNNESSAPVITYLQGKAYIADDTSAPRVAMLQHTITKGDTIATGPHSKIDIEMKDKFKITLRPNSVLTVEELTEEADHLKIICRLGRGGVLADVTKYENSSDFQIFTELVNVAVRGTQFSVDTEDSNLNKKVTVAVFEGAVAVKSAQPDENSEEYLVQKNHKMVFADDSTVMTQQLNDKDIESFWEVYEIGNRSTDINYQATSSDNKDIYQSQNQ